MQPDPRLALGVATFYHAYDRLRTSERINPPLPLPIFLGNGQRGRVTGAELTADARVTEKWRLQAGYTQLHLRLRNKAGSTAVAPTNTDPEHQFSLRSSLDLPGHWQLDAGYRDVARIVSQRLPAYDELEVRLGWNPTPALELSLVGQNLLRPRHAEFNPAPTRQEIARSLFGKAVWRY